MQMRFAPVAYLSVRLYLDVWDKIDDKSADEHYRAGHNCQQEEERHSIRLKEGNIDGCEEGSTESQEGLQHSDHCTPAA